MVSRLLLGALASLPGLSWALQLLPPTQNASDSPSTGAVWEVGPVPKVIYVEEKLASKTDDDGLTLIPPSGFGFADVFREDLSQLTDSNWTLLRVEQLPNQANVSSNSILLAEFTGDTSSITYENGVPTSEGYELVVTSTSVFIGGTGARGMWWGTRTFLQHLLLRQNGTVPVGRSVDAPAYATRGFMLDAGRKWYSPGFLKELCSYASFFKMSEFHYHLSDNYPLNRGANDTWQDVYSHFSLLPEDESLRGILHGRENETLSRAEFAELQRHCAARGVTVVPEIEAPGHCLYLTKWKPELALPKRDLLNLTHPDAVPTVKRIWSAFLPWFEAKEVHIGADEYDPALADDYIAFVNEMSDFVNSTAGKRVRIWGTHEPSETLTVSTDIVVQHWQYGQSDPVRLVAEGYDVINSQDWWAYTSIKNDHTPILPARYPQFFNESRVLAFADRPGWQWQPADFNPFNVSMQLDDGEPRNKGAILAAWNDNGPDASTQLEAYYSMRRGIALTGARAWGGARGPELDAGSVSASVDFFSPRAPGQNLDRVLLPSPEVTWTRTDEDTDGGTFHLGRGSKGMNYTLTLSVTGPFTLSGPDNTLSLDEEGHLVFEADGWVYPLRHVSEEDGLELDPGHPGRIWVNASSSTHEEVRLSDDLPATITIATDVEHGSVVWVDGEFVGRFEVFVYGGRNTQFSWSQMAFVAPLEDITGSGLERLRVGDVARIAPPEGTEEDEGPPETTNPGNVGAALQISGVAMFVAVLFTTAVAW